MACLAVVVDVIVVAVVAVVVDVIVVAVVAVVGRSRIGKYKLDAWQLFRSNGTLGGLILRFII